MEGGLVVCFNEGLVCSICCFWCDLLFFQNFYIDIFFEYYDSCLWICVWGFSECGFVDNVERFGIEYLVVFVYYFFDSVIFMEVLDGG